MRERTGYREILRVDLFSVMNLMRRMYMYTQTSSVSSIIAKKGPKIAVCAMPSYSLASCCSIV